MEVTVQGIVASETSFFTTRRGLPGARVRLVHRTSKLVWDQRIWKSTWYTLFAWGKKAKLLRDLPVTQRVTAVGDRRVKKSTYQGREEEDLQIHLNDLRRNGPAPRG